MSAATEWTTVQYKKKWAPMTSSGLQREDATHPRIPSLQEAPKKKPTEFPSLPGSKPVAGASAAAAGLNFKEMAHSSAARFEREEAARLAEQDRMGRAVSHEEIAHRTFLSHIPTRCYDDGPSEYDPPEEDEYDEDGYEENNYGEETGEYRAEEEATGETATGYSYYAANGMRRGRNEFW
jgi:hypothetical protein